MKIRGTISLSFCPNTLQIQEYLHSEKAIQIFVWFRIELTDQIGYIYPHFILKIISITDTIMNKLRGTNRRLGSKQFYLHFQVQDDENLP